MNSRPAIDVSALPESVVDHRSLVWWGNNLLIAVETTMFALLVAGYFYVRPNFTSWPPPQVNQPIAHFDPVPALGVPTFNLLLLILTLAPMILADRACLKLKRRTTETALTLLILPLMYEWLEVRRERKAGERSSVPENQPAEERS